MNSRLEDISRQLARIGGSGAFATQLTVAADDLHLESALRWLTKTNADF